MRRTCARRAARTRLALTLARGRRRSRRPGATPFPGTPPSRRTTPPPAAKPADPAAPPADDRHEAPRSAARRRAPAAEPAVGAALVYPGAEFLELFDAGRGQRYLPLRHERAVRRDRSVPTTSALKRRRRPRDLPRRRPMQQFDIGRFDEETMAYPPSVVGEGLHLERLARAISVAGTTEKRFRTIIQIVPPRQRAHASPSSRS